LVEQFRELESVAKQKTSGRPGTAEENVERSRQSFLRSPTKSIACRCLELAIPKSTIQNVIQKRLRLYAYKSQLKHEITLDDRPKLYDFASLMLNKIDDDEIFLRQICFTDEATFHMNGCVNRHNCRIWGSEQPSGIREYIHDKTKTLLRNLTLNHVDMFNRF
jgi:hypothetical protein